MLNSALKIRKSTYNEGTKNSEKVIAELFGIHGQPVNGTHADNLINEDEIGNGQMTDEAERVRM